jgi:serine protein kinase
MNESTPADVFRDFAAISAAHSIQEMSLVEYLERCKTDKSYYSNAAERMLTAIGEPRLLDTSKDEKLSRIFFNRVIKVYDSFSMFYGMEETIENIVRFYTHAAQGLEERKQMLYLLGPVGSAKSSLAEHLKFLMESQPIYVLKAGKHMSPIFESPLGIFTDRENARNAAKQYNIPVSRMPMIMSPWASKRLEEFGNDISKFTVVRLFPSRLKQIGITKIEPGDDNNLDISAIVGKVNLRKLEEFDQNDPDAYSFSGGLNRSTQGIVEFVEAFKAPLKMLHPFLTATQERNYLGTENIGAIPFQGLILLHSNEQEFATFKSNKKNEAILDRIYPVKVKYTLRVSEEQKIYEKLISESDIGNVPTAPHTLEMLARFSVLTRLREHDNSNLFSKMRVYDGEFIKETDPNAKTVQEYRDAAGQDEGMSGFSTRQAFKVLALTYNYDSEEISADPVHLMYILEQAIKKEQYGSEIETKWLNILKETLATKYIQYIGDEIQKAYLESYKDYGQNLYDRYVGWADAWLEDKDFKDPDTNTLMSRELLDRELSKIEKPAGIGNPKDFRNEVVKFTLRAKANNGGKSPEWTAYEKIKEVIEKRMFSNVEDLLPIISFGSKKEVELDKKHKEFLGRMEERGYTYRQTQRAVEYYIRARKAG